jgi:hypothetical protein
MEKYVYSKKTEKNEMNLLSKKEEDLYMIAVYRVTQK